MAHPTAAQRCRQPPRADGRKANVRISRLARTTLLVLSVANFINFLDRQVIAALAPMLKSYWHLSDAQVGLLGTAFEVLYALAPLPIAVLSDRWLRRKVVALALAVWSGAMAILGGAASYGMLLLGRAVLGLGEAGYGPSALAWLGDVYPPTHRSRAVGLHDLGSLLGSAGGYALGGVLGQALGWRSAFYVSAAVGLAVSVAVWLLPEPRQGYSDYQALGVAGKETPRRAIGPAEMARDVLSVPTLQVAYAATTLISFAVGGLTYWVPSFAVRIHGYSQREIGLLIGAITLLSGAAGVLSCGFLGDWLLQRTPAARLLIIGASAAAGFPLALAAICVPDRALFLVLSALATYLFTFYAPTIGPLVHQVTLPDVRATAIAFYLFLAHVLGSATSPAIIGVLSDRTGDLRLGVAAPLAAALAGGLLALWGTRYVAPDAEAVAVRLRTEEP
jgi:predicted MFS family arabinose efflux permease